MTVRFLSLCIALALLLAAPGAQSQTLQRVERKPFEHVLQGEVSFDDMAASSFPGTQYWARMPFKGAIVGTRFNGHIPILRKNGRLTYSVNIGAPDAPLETSNTQRRYSTLHLIEDADVGDSPSVLSRVFRPGLHRHDTEVGFGTVVIGFTSRQYVFGFDIVAVRNRSVGPFKVQVQAFAIDGTPAADPVVLPAAGRVTLKLDTERRDIAGIGFTNLGAVGFAIDNIVFELPLVIGMRSPGSGQIPPLPPAAATR